MPLLAFLVLSAPARSADSFQSAESIRAVVEAVVTKALEQDGTDYRIEPARSDNRLRLTRCEQPLDGFILSGQRGSGYFSVGVRCAGVKPWTVYRTVRVSAYQTVVVLKEPVKQGTPILPSNLLLQRREITGLHGGHFTEPAAVLGQIARRTLPGGLLLTPDHLTMPSPVKRGQAVRIRAKSADFEISMPGMALSDGLLGQRIRVKNSQSGRIVEGVVTQPGIVTID